MQFISRDAQETIVLQMERDYGSLVMAYNQKSADFELRAEAFLEEVERIMRLTNLESDKQEFLAELTVFLQKQLAAQYRPQ